MSSQPTATVTRDLILKVFEICKKDEIININDVPPTFEAAQERLSQGLQQVEKQLNQEVAQHNAELMHQVTTLQNTRDKLHDVMRRLATLQANAHRLKAPIQQPYHDLTTKALQLQNMWDTSQIFRKVSAFVGALGKMKVYMQSLDQSKPDSAPTDVSLIRKLQDLPHSAKVYRELSLMLEDTDLRGIAYVAEHSKYINDCYDIIYKRARDELVGGFAAEFADKTKIDTALQMFYNMDMLREEVRKCIQKEQKDALKFIVDELKAQKISQIAEAQGHSPDRLRSVVFQALENTKVKVSVHLHRLSVLHSVLCTKRVSSSNVDYLHVVFHEDEGDKPVAPHHMKITDNFPIETWGEISAFLHRQINENLRHNKHIVEVLIASYPRLHEKINQFAEACIVALGESGTAVNLNSNDWIQTVLRQNFELPFIDGAYTKIHQSLERLHDKLEKYRPSCKAQPGHVPTEQQRSMYLEDMVFQNDIRTCNSIITQEIENCPVHLVKNIFDIITKLLRIFSEFHNVGCTLTNDGGIYKAHVAQVDSPPNFTQVLNILWFNTLCSLTSEVSKATQSKANKLSQFSHGAQLSKEADVSFNTLRYQTVDNINKIAQSLLEPVFQKCTDIADSHIYKDTWANTIECSQCIKSITKLLQDVQGRFFKYMDTSSVAYAHLCRVFVGHVSSTYVRVVSVVPHQQLNAISSKINQDLLQFQLSLSHLCIADREMYGPYLKEWTALRQLLSDSVDEDKIIANTVLRPVILYHVLIQKRGLKPILELRGKTAYDYWSELLDECDDIEEEYNWIGTLHTQYRPISGASLPNVPEKWLGGVH